MILRCHQCFSCSKTLCYNKSSITFKSSNNTATDFVVRTYLAAAFVHQRPTQTSLTTEQLQKLPASVPVSHARDIFMSRSIVSHPLAKTTQFTVCYGDHLCGAEKEHTGGKIWGISFMTELRLQRGKAACWTLVQHQPGTQKPPSLGVGGGGGGCLLELWVLELPCEGALLDLDNCLQRSLDTSRQMPLPIKHSVVCSFTPQQLLSNSEKRSKYVSDDSPAPPHLRQQPFPSTAPLLITHGFPRGDATWGGKEARKRLGASEGVNEDSSPAVRRTQ